MLQRLAVMAVRCEPGARYRALHLETQDRYGARRAAIGERGEETEEKLLAEHLALVVEYLDADRIHVRRTMDGGTLVCLADRQQPLLAQIILDVLRQRTEM